MWLTSDDLRLSPLVGYYVNWCVLCQKPRSLRMVGIGSDEPEDAATEEGLLLVGIAATSGREKYQHKSILHLKILSKDLMGLMDHIAELVFAVLCDSRGSIRTRRQS